MFMLWGDWERNGYHDSDFYAALWNTETQDCEVVQTGSTAYAGGVQVPQSVPWTDEQLELARQWLAKKIFVVLRAAEDRDVLTPNKIDKGDRVQLLEKHKNQAFTTIMVECPNCYGKGYWQNPHRSDDKRECFKCKGECVIQAKGEKIKGQWHRFEPGVVGSVLWSGAFGTFFKNGYNKPGRENITATIKLDDGRFMKAPLSKLRLAKSVDTDEAILQRSEELSYHMNPFSIIGGRGWWTHNFAAALMAKKTGILPTPESDVLVMVADDGPSSEE
jgi:hypothetical protein